MYISIFNKRSMIKIIEHIFLYAFIFAILLFVFSACEVKRDVFEDGYHVVLKVNEEDVKTLSEDELTKAIDSSVKIIRKRLDFMDLAVAVIEKNGTDKIIIKIPAVNNYEEVFSSIEITGKLEFSTSSDHTVLGYKDTVFLTEADVIKSAMAFNNDEKPVVALTFTAGGAIKLKNATTAALNSNLYIYFDGNQISNLLVNEVVTSGRIIIENPTWDNNDVKYFSMIISSGSLPVKFYQSEKMLKNLAQ